MSDDMDSPPEREMKDFQFRQMKKARVFDPPDDLPKDRSSLVTISNKFGLTFVALDRTFKVYVTQDILAADKADGNANEIVNGIPALAEVTVELALHHLALSCDELTLSVCGTSEETGLSITFYDVRSFMNKTRPQKLPFALLQPAVAPGTSVQDLKWNPTHASMLAICLSDGSMKILDVVNAVKVQAELPAASGISCICWSPKGKQVAAGKMDATVSQYTPALEEKKVIQCPHFYTNEEPVKALDVLWLRTFVFAVVYAAADESLETPPELVLISLPKKDEKVEAKYVNFSESVYGSCTERQHHYFLSQVEDWDLMFAASAVAIEVSVIARQDDKMWELWLLEDASRAELPVTDTKDDTFPLGVAIDYTNQQSIFITNEKVLPPVPVMLMLSTEGLLCPFALLNLNPGVKQLVSPPTALALEGERLPPPGLAVQRSKAVVSVSSASPAFPSLSLTSLAAPSPAAPAAPFSTAPFSSAPLSLVSSSSSASSGFSFTLPNAGSTSAPSAFSLGTSTPLSSGSSGFSFAPKLPSETSSAPSAFSFNSVSIKPSAGIAAAAASTPNIIAPPQTQDTASLPTVKLNLNERFSAVESKAPAFSFISQPKPPAPSSSGLMAPVIPAAKPPTALPPVGPVQISTPPTALQKAASTMVRPQPPQTSVSVKALEKQLQQKKDSDPIMAGIAEEIAHFQKELEDLKARNANVWFKVGTNEEMRALRKDSDDLHVFTLEIKETTESLHGDIGTLKNTVLESFAWAEEAKIQSELSNNRTYRQLLFKKPLDPRNEEQLKEIRRLYQYVKFSVEDVNAVLDDEWEKHLEKKKKQKHMVVPGREGLYNTLSNNLYIINQQQNRVDQLVRELTSLRLYNKSATAAANQISATTSTTSMESELECLRDALLKARLDETPPKAKSQSPEIKILPGKQSQLRNFLSKRQMPPKRSTAPANLSRSAFLSPKYYEDRDEGSSPSFLPDSLEPHPDHLELEEEELLPLPPLISAMPPALSTPRHPTVVRTPSIQPGFGAIQSTPLAKINSLHGLGISPIASPVPSNKINLSGAESTALATRTVKHGAPPTERTLHSTISAQQAAATAALRRQMADQKPAFSSPFTAPVASQPGAVFGQQLASNGSVSSSTAAAGFTSMASSTGGFGHSTAVINPSLTESTFKIVPQVVNVQDFIDKGTGSASSNISSTVPDPVSQVFTTISSNHAKRNPPQVVQKVPSESSSGLVFGAPKTDLSVVPTSSVEQSSSKGFSTGSAGFSFTPMTQGAQAFSNPLTEQPGSIFGQKPQSVPSSTSPAGSSAGGEFLGGFGNKSIEDTTNKNLFSTTGGFSQSTQPASPTLTLNEASEEEKENSNADVQPPKPTSGETLGVFSGLRVGQGEEVKDTSSTPAAAFAFGEAAAGLGKETVPFNFSPSLLKPVEESAEGDSSKVASSGSLFKPPEMSTKPAFSVPHSSATVSALPTSLSSLLSAPPYHPEEPKSPPQSSDPTPPPEKEPPQESPSFPVEAEPVVDASTTAVTAAATEPTPAPPLATPAPVLGPPPSYTASTEATLAVPDSVIPTSTPTAPQPSETTATTAPVSQEAPAVFQAPVSDKPGSIFTQSAPVTTDSSSLEVTPVISTAALSGPTSTTVTVTSAPAAAAGDAVFGQPAGAPASSAPAATGFGAAAFGAPTGTGFGKSVFGQVSGFGQPATANSSTTSSGFTFGQSAFGESPSGTTAGGAGGGGGLFGASTASNASSFSFGTGSANTASCTGTGSFGQTMSAFGQSSGFGQGSVFGSNTTTSPSTGFGFGQSAAFGSSFNSFGQQRTVFGQQQMPSGGGLFGSGSTSAPGSSPGGGFFSGLGGKPSEDAANKNPFGATASTGGFGQPAQLGSNSLFGTSGAKGFSFTQPAFSEQKSSGTFSTGGGSVASQGFGSFSTPAKSGGFGSAPVFGSPPSFGGSPGFGSTASFGSAPAFNSAIAPSAGKVFGEGTAASSMGGFGFASPPSAPSFGALANQSAPSFGTLAQQGPGFGSQPSSFQGFGQQPQAGGFSGNTFGAANQSGSQTFASWRN
ncbi:nuclear pore complex protein Nup214 isoform X2 [Gouania willdenowi]|uniref:nuclear pore complex protein Nup214 isoform X2 n=1 Tax=Gouania willdenowi TaxID=441366 RepID=UPI001054BCB7|nr:nuclear pore complex protein Nup214 isoform X2 [Gouania willdenowi]